MSHEAAARKTIVEGVRIDHMKPGDPLFPYKMFEEKGQEATEIWWLWVTVRTGLMPSSSMSFIYLSEKDALKAKERYAEGAEINEDPHYWGSGERRQALIRSIIDGELPNFGISAGDEDLYLPWKVLSESRTSTRDGLRISQQVVDFLGRQRIGELKNRFGENWEAAAQFEYCWLELPHSSPAYIAAACRYHYFVSQDDFSAGYLLRDLECLVHGVEAEAIKAIEMRRKAGQRGREASEKARKRRIESLLKGMEEISGRNPDIAALGPTSLAALGLGQAIDTDPDLWRQGRGQVEEYLGEMRRGEAGETVKARYLSLLTSKPPRRF